MGSGGGVCSPFGCGVRTTEHRVSELSLSTAHQLVACFWLLTAVAAHQRSEAIHMSKQI